MVDNGIECLYFPLVMQDTTAGGRYRRFESLRRHPATHSFSVKDKSIRWSWNCSFIILWGHTSITGSNTTSCQSAGAGEENVANGVKASSLHVWREHDKNEGKEKGKWCVQDTKYRGMNHRKEGNTGLSKIYSGSNSVIVL